MQPIGIYGRMNSIGCFGFMMNDFVGIMCEYSPRHMWKTVRKERNYEGVERRERLI